MAKLTEGSQDFSGQKERDAGQGAGSAEVSVNRTSQPVDQKSTSTVFQSSDPKLHTDASFVPGDGRVDGTPGRGGYPIL